MAVSVKYTSETLGKFNQIDIFNHSGKIWITATHFYKKTCDTIRLTEFKDEKQVKIALVNPKKHRTITEFNLTSMLQSIDFVKEVDIIEYDNVIKINLSM